MFVVKRGRDSIDKLNPPFKEAESDNMSVKKHIHMSDRLVEFLEHKRQTEGKSYSQTIHDLYYFYINNYCNTTLDKKKDA